MKIGLTNNRVAVTEIEPKAQDTNSALEKQVLKNEVPDFVATIPHNLTAAVADDAKTNNQYADVMGELNNRFDSTLIPEKDLEKQDKLAMGKSRWEPIKLKNMYVEPLKLDESLFEATKRGVDNDDDLTYLFFDGKNKDNSDDPSIPGVRQDYIEKMLPFRGSSSGGIYRDAEEIADASSDKEWIDDMDAHMKKQMDQFLTACRLNKKVTGPIDKIRDTANEKEHKRLRAEAEKIAEKELGLAPLSADASPAEIGKRNAEITKFVRAYDAKNFKAPYNDEWRNAEIEKAAQELFKQNYDAEYKSRYPSAKKQASYYNMNNKDGSDATEIIPIHLSNSDICGWLHYRVAGYPVAKDSKKYTGWYAKHSAWAKDYIKDGEDVYEPGKPLGLEYATKLMSYLKFKEVNFTPEDGKNSLEDIIKYPYIYNIHPNNTMDIYCATGETYLDEPLTPEERDYLKSKGIKPLVIRGENKSSLSGTGKGKYVKSGKFGLKRPSTTDSVSDSAPDNNIETESYNLEQLRECLRNSNGNCAVDNLALIVFTPDSFDRDYSERERSYVVDGNCLLNDNCPICGDCLDGQDMNVNLSQYIDRAERPWVIQECYLLN